VTNDASHFIFLPCSIRISGFPRLAGHCFLTRKRMLSHLVTKHWLSTNHPYLCNHFCSASRENLGGRRGFPQVITIFQLPTHWHTDFHRYNSRIFLPFPEGDNNQSSMFNIQSLLSWLSATICVLNEESVQSLPAGRQVWQGCEITD
jgi:hypothetical protein